MLMKEASSLGFIGAEMLAGGHLLAMEDLGVGRRSKDWGFP
jgi:hypothetical protein